MARPLSPNARIAIMGAGCAGLTCAEELRDRGYRDITVFEAQRRAGGKIRSVPYKGAPAEGRGLFEAGTVFFVPSPMWTKLLRRYGVSESQTLMPRVRLADIDGGTTENPMRYTRGYSAATRALHLFRFLSTLRRHAPGHDRRAGIAPHVSPELCGPTRDWFDRQGMGYVRDVLLPIAGGAQFGPLVDSVPAIYVLRMLTLLSRYSLPQQLRLSMPQLRAGHEAVWTKLAATHDVRFSSPITQISANGKVQVRSAAGEEQFDALIVAAPTESYLKAATNLDEAERSLLRQVRTIDREVITARVSGLGKNVFYAPRYGDGGAIPPGHPYLFYEVDAHSGLYTFHPYHDRGCGPVETEQAIRALVTRLGGTLESIEHRAVVRGWFPHFAESALRGGAYAQLEAMQGRHNVWHAGELLAGIGVPHGMEYAASLVSRMTGDAHA